MSVYSEFRYWSPLTDRNEVRLSMADSHGREFFMLLPEDEGKRYRDRRDAALEHIGMAIEQGLQPGRVRVR